MHAVEFCLPSWTAISQTPLHLSTTPKTCYNALEIPQTPQQLFIVPTTIQIKQDMIILQPLYDSLMVVLTSDSFILS